MSFLVALGGCGGVGDAHQIFEPGLGDPGPRPHAYLNFPADAYQAPRVDHDSMPGFPRRLSETGAFRDVARLEPAPGVVPYDLLSPLWSDGAFKQRWVSLPELGAVRADDVNAWRLPEGSVLVKHFELQLDEREGVQRRLETRLLVAARGGTYYGVTYKWNADEMDADIVLDGSTEVLTIRGPDGVEREQPYLYPGPRDCNGCHSSSSGYVLGLRTRQLNRDFRYRDDFPPVNQLVAWSGWGFLDRSFDNTDAELTPRLANPTDETETLEQRVRAYWDGNCSMCHAGKEGSVTGWDARSFIPLEEQGLYEPPRGGSPDAPPMLIDPGDPADSYIYVRAATVENRLRMPPLGRNRIDGAYVELLQRWIESL